MSSVRIVALLATVYPAVLFAQTASPARTVEFRFTPAARTQLALWIEKPDGTFMATVALTQAVGLRGIGNRPGAAQMNSGFRWPYGRREGALPIWAHRRAGAPGAGQFRRVIFQNRVSEGDASSTTADSTIDSYFCLSFNDATTRRDGLDAITCASMFKSDKGRFLVGSDVARGYAEPAQIGQEGIMRPLDPTSLYPPRRDLTPCTDCLDTPDVAGYADHVRQVMPDIDAITVATPPGDIEQAVLFTAPEGWPDGEYVAWLEVNIEGDYNATFNGDTHPTPKVPVGAWDSWAMDYGYPYRGQPSVAFHVRFAVGAPGSTATSSPAFYSDVDGFGPDGGRLHAFGDGLVADDPVAAAGSGADRLRMGAGRDYRFQATVRGPEQCGTHAPPDVPTMVTVRPVDDQRHSHQWGRLHFVAPASERPIAHYELRYSPAPISPQLPSSFAQALPGVAANADTDALMIPTDSPAGTAVEIDFGGLNAETQYHVALRAVDSCNVTGRYAVAQLTTTRVHFTQLSGCFIATAAYGSPLQQDVGALRALRDRLVARDPLFAAAADLYYRSGPAPAAVIARSPVARALTRALLRPIAQLARAFAPAGSTTR
ncbi:MAG: CFI-box-CTERM domain-containing protein [Pseudomonadota bacterium]